MEEVYGRKFKLFSVLKTEVAEQIKNGQLQSDDPGDIIKAAGMLRYLTEEIDTDMSISGKLFYNDTQIEEVLSAYFTEPDPELTKLLSEAWSSIASGDIKIKGSTLIMGYFDNKRVLLGIEVESGQFVSLGITEITAPCRIERFNRLIKDGDELETAPPRNIRTCQVKGIFDNYPDGYTNPYSLPDDLFLLKAGTSYLWGALELKESRMGKDLQEFISPQK